MYGHVRQAHERHDRDPGDGACDRGYRRRPPTEQSQTAKIADRGTKTYFGGVGIGIVRTTAFILHFSCPRHCPDPQRVISAPGDNQGALGPFLLSKMTVFVFHVHPGWFDNRETANRARVSTEDMGAAASGKVPDTNSAICRAADKGILRGRKCPDAALVPNQRSQEPAVCW